MAQKKCGFLDLHCVLSQVPGLKGVADGADALYKGALTSAGSLLKGSPFEGVVKGLTTSESGDTHRGLSQTIHGALDAAASLTGVNAIPGVSTLTQGIEDGLNFLQGVPAKAAGGANDPNAKPPAAPSGAAVNQILNGTPVPSTNQGAALQARRASTAPQDPKKRTFTKTEWVAHVNQKETVGGTQPG